MRGALDGIRVVDMATLIAAPGAARHLADFLEAVGFARYAAIARGEHTRQVIAAWDTDVSDGYRAFRDAMSASGVEPPDLPDLRWGVVMGP